MMRYWATLGTGVATLTALTVVYGYEQSFLLLNGAAFLPGDLVFPHLTHLGDGVILTSLLMLGLWGRRPGLATTALTTMVVTALVVNTLKFWVFGDCRRPMGVFEPEMVRMLGRTPEYYFSFPSGHSTSAGAGFTLLAYALPRLGWFWGLVALLTAYSRVYVGSHFPFDVAAGLVLGAACAVAAVRLLLKRMDKYFVSLPLRTSRRLRIAVYTLAVFTLLVAVSNRYFGGWVG